MFKYRAVFNITPAGGGQPITLVGEESTSMAYARNMVIRLRQTSALIPLGNSGTVQRKLGDGPWETLPYMVWNPNGMGPLNA
jgi:hypothetical protein